MAPIYTPSRFEFWKREHYRELYETMAEFGIPTDRPNVRPGQPFAEFAVGIYFGEAPKHIRLAFYARRRCKQAGIPYVPDTD